MMKTKKLSVSGLSRADTRRLCEDEADPVKRNCKKYGEDGGEIKKTTLPPATIIVLIMLRDKV